MAEISIIIPCYNVDKYLARCLESILCQTVDTDLLEIILINDHSDDQTWDIISQYEQRYSDMIIAVNCPEKIPTGSVRNIGLSYANGNYLMFIDGDDMIAPTMIKTLYDTIMNYKLDIVECNFDIFSDEKTLKITNNPFSMDLFENISNTQRKDLLLELTSRSTVWGKIISKVFIQQFQIHFCETGNGDDGYFASLCTLYMRNYAYINNPLYFYYINQTGIMWNKQRFDTSVTETNKAQMQLVNYLNEDETNHKLYQNYFHEFEFIAITKMIVDSTSRYHAFFESFHSALLVECFISLSELYPSFTENPYFKERFDFIEIIEKVLLENQ